MGWGGVRVEGIVEMLETLLPNFMTNDSFHSRLELKRDLQFWWFSSVPISASALEKYDQLQMDNFRQKEKHV